MRADAMRTDTGPAVADPLAAWRIGSEPYYRPRGDECVQFEAAWSRRLPLLLKGPTGCGKTRFVQHMAWRLGRPLVTVACNEDTTAGDLLGRWLLDAQGMAWQDGPLALAARHGALCYLDEIVEARSDALVAIHPLTDDRRTLPLDRASALIHAHPDFMLLASYNPGGGRELKPATRQRFCGLAFDYPEAEDEVAVLMREGGVAVELASSLVALGRRTRRLAGQGLEEGASTRMLVRAAQLVRQGLAPRAAALSALVVPLADDDMLQQALVAAVDATF